MKFSELQRLQRMEGITVLSADERIEQLEARLRTITKERDALRAEIAEMERQEPARLVTPTAYRWRYRGAIKWQYGELTEETVRLAKEHNHEVQSLGILPGAKGEEKMKLSEKIQEALREQQEINLSDPAVQRRLAAQWGYVPAGAQPAPSVPDGWKLVPIVSA